MNKRMIGSILPLVGKGHTATNEAAQGGAMGKEESLLIACEYVSFFLSYCCVAVIDGCSDGSLFRFSGLCSR